MRSERDGDEGERTLQACYRLSQWLDRVRTDPALLDTLSGVQEWAYLSRVDDTGQPFKLAIPAGYDPNRAWPLVIVMHGYGGNHLEYSGGLQSNPDYFELHILGRARGGWYYDLSEADVLDAVDYVRAALVRGRAAASTSPAPAWAGAAPSSWRPGIRTAGRPDGRCADTAPTCRCGTA